MTREVKRSISVQAIVLAVAALTAVVATAIPAEAARPKCFGQAATIVGTRRADVLRGTPGRDVIAARGGPDQVRARGGNDLICLGGGQFNIAFAGGGDDRVRGGKGTDAVFPEAGNDVFDGGPGWDFVTYEGLPIPITADLGANTVTGRGNDRIPNVGGVAGSEADDNLIGTDGDDELHGYGGNDTFAGGAGDDFLVSGAGDDLVDGGPGHDFVDNSVSNAGPDLGDDTFTDVGMVGDLDAGTATGPPGVGNDTLQGIEGMSGTLGDDTLKGDEAFNDLVGLEGDDTISVGEPGEPDHLGTTDVVLPGGGNDTVTGSSGVDAVDYSFLSLEVEPTAGVTVDLQKGTASGADVGTDDLSSMETAAGTFFDDFLTGSAQANVLIGLDGSDELDGAAGDDALDGDAFSFGLPFELPGTDSLDGGAGTDACVGGETTDAGCESTDWPPASRLLSVSSLARMSAVRSYLGSR